MLCADKCDSAQHIYLSHLYRGAQHTVCSTNGSSYYSYSFLVEPSLYLMALHFSRLCTACSWLGRGCAFPFLHRALRSEPAASAPPTYPTLVLSILVLPTLSLGNYELDVSPYEDTVTSKPWKMNLSKLNMLKPGVEGN